MKLTSILVQGGLLFLLSLQSANPAVNIETSATSSNLATTSALHP
ncbi:hypothetical protein [Sneathiella sp. HT1-7]|nr:hypothetical protein [Sneathiella sp. HT1-7]